MGEGSLKPQKYLRKSLMTEKQSSQKEGLKQWCRAGVRRAKLSEKVSFNQERTRDQTETRVQYPEPTTLRGQVGKQNTGSEVSQNGAREKIEM